MVLFAQMNQSIDWFLKDMVRGKTLDMVKDVVLAMIAVRPREERERLKKFVLAKVVVEKEWHKIEEDMTFAAFDEDEEFDHRWSRTLENDEDYEG